MDDEWNQERTAQTIRSQHERLAEAAERESQLKADVERLEVEVRRLESESWGWRQRAERAEFLLDREVGRG